MVNWRSKARDPLRPGHSMALCKAREGGESATQRSAYAAADSLLRVSRTMVMNSSGWSLSSW